MNKNLNELIKTKAGKMLEELNETLSNLEFARDAYYGLGFRWYATDSAGNLAVFGADELPIPKIVFNNENDYKELDSFFMNLPKITSSKLVKKFEEIKRNTQGKADFRGALRDAEKGIYAIDEHVEMIKGNRVENYYLTAIPEIKLNKEELPERIMELLEPYHLPIIFSEIETIDVTKYFDCE